jgi:hypothetical protein
MYGGPVNPSTGQGFATGQRTPGWVVRIVRGRTVVATAYSDDVGRFTVRGLVPGYYSLACGGGIPFTVAPGGTTEVDCPLPVG